MDEPFAALDEITRFKLNNDLLELWQEPALHRRLRHPQRVRERLLSSRIVVMAARPGRVFADLADRRALSARRGVPHLAGLHALCRAASDVLAAPSPWRSDHDGH